MAASYSASGLASHLDVPGSAPIVPVSGSGGRWHGCVALKDIGPRPLQNGLATPFVHDVVHRYPPVAVVTGEVGEFHHGARGPAAAGADGLVAGLAVASRPAGALDYDPVALALPPGQPFNSTGMTRSARDVANRTWCRHTFPNGLRVPFIT